MEGNFTSRALVIGERPRVNGEIAADDVAIRGSTEGHIRARRVQLTKMAKVMGDILYESLSINSGAYVEGQLERLEKRGKPEIKLVRDTSDKERILVPLAKDATVD